MELAACIYVDFFFYMYKKKIGKDALELAAEHGHTNCAIKLMDLGIEVQTHTHTHTHTHAHTHTYTHIHTRMLRHIQRIQCSWCLREHIL